MIKHLLVITSIFSFIFFICSCTYTDIKKTNMEVDLTKYNQIPLNVSSFVIQETHNKSQNIDQIKKYRNSIFENLEAWANNKFKVKGTKNQALLEIKKFDIKLLERKKSKGVKRLLFTGYEDKYLIEIALNLIFLEENSNKIKTDVLGSIEFIFSENMSLIDKDKEFIIALDQLIFQIDKAFNKVLLRKKLEKYIL